MHEAIPMMDDSLIYPSLMKVTDGDIIAHPDLIDASGDYEGSVCFLLIDA